MNEVIVMRPEYSNLKPLHDLCDSISSFLDLKNSTMVEVGSYQGESSEIFADRFGKIYCIYPWQNGYDERSCFVEI